MATIQYIVSASEKKELVHIDTYSATKKDLQCLLESSMYLSDAVINAYIRILKAQPSIQARQDGDAYLETTYFSTMIRDDSTTKLRDQNEKSFRVVRTLTYLQHDMVLDSMGSSSRRPELDQLLKGLHNRINHLAYLKMKTQTKWKDVKLKEWRVVECINRRMQTDGSSCGLFVLKFMKLWAGSRLSSIFTQKDMTNFRLKLAVTLVDYPWNKVKGSPGYKSTDVDEAIEK
ncbi:uncharacterized protein LOC112898582 isoform X2 [Panicum hallii]|uniref:uncharacterized protein LOC112898582 isoform X2 n=1 Tax=Panicum hallii TaxID=206008 RepID=UPI000DF4DCD4|nr:uncharacterized protein LOC112898582 isoform X2 [Panicum hallii]